MFRAFALFLSVDTLDGHAVSDIVDDGEPGKGGVCLKDHAAVGARRFDRPVDTFLQMRWVTGIAPFCVVPSGIGDQSAEIGGSTVSASGKARRSPGERLWREWSRFVYRRRVQKYSRGWFETEVERR